MDIELNGLRDYRGIKKVLEEELFGVQPEVDFGSPHYARIWSQPLDKESMQVGYLYRTDIDSLPVYTLRISGEFLGSTRRERIMRAINLIAE